MNDILVSVSVIAYNQEKYIEQTLQSIVNQKTNFKFEVLVHDDASSDKTPDIISAFQEKYPEIVFPILQKENQHRQGKWVSKNNFDRARGKYIALCEGDDYWTNENKLQMEVDYLQAHDDCSLVFTNGTIFDCETSETKTFVPYTISDKKYYIKGNRKIDLSDIYEMEFIPTASIIFRTSAYKQMPVEYTKKCPTGDLKTRLFFNLFGYSYFIDEETVCYRLNVPGSIMTSWKYTTRKQNVTRANKVLEMISDVDRLSDYKYSESLFILKKPFIRSLILNSKSSKILKNPENKRVFKELSFVEKTAHRLGKFMPEWLYKKIKTKRK